MRVGMYSEHLDQDGQIGTGASKYIHYLIRELERLGVDVVRLRKGDNKSHDGVLHDPQAHSNARLGPRRPPVIMCAHPTPFTHRRNYPRRRRTIGIDSVFPKPVKERLARTPSLVCRVKMGWPG